MEKNGKPPLILASASPRRRRMLEEAGVRFEVMESGADETAAPGASPEEAALGAALAKALKVVALAGGGRWVLAADTVVELDGAIFGKPADAADARRMLALLSGKVHRVLTAVVLARGERRHHRVIATSVEFAALPAREIDWYIASGEPFDKAGGYGIQGLAAGFVRRVEGSYTNVVGLPLAETLELLEMEGLAPWNRGR